MKFFNVKTAIAAVCVVAAGFGGVKAYNNANQTEADLLLAENVEALSSGDNDFLWEFLKRGASGSAGAFVGGLASAATATVTGNPIATGAAGLAAGAATEEGVYNGLTEIQPDTPEKKTGNCQETDLVVTPYGCSSIIVRTGQREYCEMTTETTSCGVVNNTCNINGGRDGVDGSHWGGDVGEIPFSEYKGSPYDTPDPTMPNYNPSANYYQSGLPGAVRYQDSQGQTYQMGRYPDSGRNIRCY